MNALYRLGWLAIQFYFKQKGLPIVHLRNSAVDGSIKLFKSDLDGTVIVDDPDQVKVIEKNRKFLKKIFPILGEFNYYDLQSINWLKNKPLNSIEINRDPELKKLTASSVLTPITNHSAEASKISFLLFSAINDYKQITSKKHSHIEKWQKHFQRLNLNVYSIKTNSDLISALTDLIAKNLNSEKDKKAILNSLDVGLRSIASKNREELFKSNPKLQSYLISFFPEFYAKSLDFSLDIQPYLFLIFFENIKISILAAIRHGDFYINKKYTLEKILLLKKLLKNVRSIANKQDAQELDEIQIFINEISKRLLLDSQLPIKNYSLKVKTDSMSPIIKIGDILEIDYNLEMSDLKPLDIVLFRRGEKLFCHYVFENNFELNKTLVTRSLKNSFVNESPVSSFDYLGKVTNFKLKSSDLIKSRIKELVGP